MIFENVDEEAIKIPSIFLCAPVGDASVALLMPIHSHPHDNHYSHHRIAIHLAVIVDEMMFQAYLCPSHITDNLVSTLADRYTADVYARDTPERMHGVPA